MDPCGDVRWRRRVATLVACAGRDMWRRRKWRYAAYAVQRRVVAETCGGGGVQWCQRVTVEACSSEGVQQ